jgi:hypothetical protein
MGDLRTNETPRALLGALLQSTVAQNDVNRRHEDTDVGILEFSKANVPGFSRDVRALAVQMLFATPFLVFQSSIAFRYIDHRSVGP